MLLTVSRTLSSTSVTVPAAGVALFCEVTVPLKVAELSAADDSANKLTLPVVLPTETPVMIEGS